MFTGGLVRPTLAAVAVLGPLADTSRSGALSYSSVSRLEPTPGKCIFGICPSIGPPSQRGKATPDSVWVVDVLWPDGDTEVVKGFATEKAAAEWIAEDIPKVGKKIISEKAAARRIPTPVRAAS